MQGIYLAAIIATLFSSVFIGGMIFPRASKKDRPVLIGGILATLPMCALAYYCVREPFLSKVWISLTRLYHPDLSFELLSKTKLYLTLKTLEAPLSEELSKIWPLLIPAFRKRIDSKNAVKVAMALGLGFGIGEIWFLAELLARKDPATASLPWYQLSGFLGERFMVCLMHGAFTAVVLSCFRSSFLSGLLGAMGLHFIGNYPIALSRMGLTDWSKSTWQAILSFWVTGYFLSMMALLAYLNFRKFQVGRFLFGKAKCPECKMIYDRPLWGMNAVDRRYEKCPGCKRYHWIKREHEVREEA